MTIDLALTTLSDGGLLVHRATCPDARAEAKAGLPVLTMLGCERMPDQLSPRHSCLDDLSEQGELFDADEFVEKVIKPELEERDYQDRRPAESRGYVAHHHAPAAHVAAEQTAAHEGSKRIVSPDSDRHIMLRYFNELDLHGRTSTLIDAGVYAHAHLGVGKRSVTGWDTGRRRASELAEFGLLEQEIGKDGHAYYRISEQGRQALQIVDSGKRWSG